MDSVDVNQDQVVENFAMAGLTKAAARNIDRDFLNWEKDTLCVFQEANEHDSARRFEA